MNSFDSLPYPPHVLQWNEDVFTEQRRNAQRLTEELTCALGNGEKQFRIPPGEYRFQGKQGLLIEDAADLELNAEGATFWFSPGFFGLTFRRCRNIRLSGLSCDLDTLPFLQGVIESIDRENRLTVRLDLHSVGLYSRRPQGLKRFRVMFLDENGARETDNIDFRPEIDTIAFYGERRLQIPVHTYVAEHWKRQMRPPRPGDKIALGMRRECGTLFSDSCEKMLFSDISIFASGGFAFFEAGYGEGGNIYRNCRLIRRPGTDRLLASAGDCFHSMNQKQGPIIEGCEFSWAMDDLVNIHGFFHVIPEIVSPEELILTTPFGTHLSNGTELTFYAPPYGTVKGSARIKEIKPLADFPGNQVENIQQYYKTKFDIDLRDFPDSFLCRVKLDRPTEVEAFDLAGSYNACGAGAVLRGNHLHDGHVRGILLKSRNCRIEDNLIERIALSGIILKPELYWLEGPMPDHITISGNRLNDCAFDYTGIAGIVTMSGFCPPPGDRFTATINQQNIEVLGNTISVCRSGPGILLANGQHLRVRDNRMENLYSNPNVSAAENLRKRLENPALTINPPDQSENGILFVSCRKIECEGNEMK